MATHSSVLAWRIPGGAWWAAVSGVSQSRTRLKRLRSSSAGSTLETTQTSVYGKNELRGLTWASFLLQFPSLGLKSQCWEREKQTPKWNRASSGPTHRASTPDTWRAVLATEQKESPNSHPATALAPPSPASYQHNSYQHNSYQHNLRKDLAYVHIKSALSPKALSTHSLHRDASIYDTSSRLEQITVSLEFIQAKKVKENNKAQELLSVETVREKPLKIHNSGQLSSVQSLSRVQLFAASWTAACQAFLSITNSQSLLKLMPIESVIPSNHLILCHPLLLLPSVFPSSRVFSNESALHIWWTKYWRFSFSISPSNEYSGLISFRMDWLDLLAVQGTLKTLLQHHFQKHQFFGAQLSLQYKTLFKVGRMYQRFKTIHWNVGQCQNLYSLCS